MKSNLLKRYAGVYMKEATMATNDPPEHVTLLREFANTVDVSEGSDLLSDVSGLTGWLRDQGLLGRRTPATDADLQLAVRLRTGLRERMTANGDGSGAGSKQLDQATAQIPLRLSFTGDVPRLVPEGTAGQAALGQVLVAVAEAVADQTWQRLKICRADDCQWAYFDASKNRSKTWCAMGVCGNREKTRNYRARRRAVTEVG
ncbi:MAG: CGNR zinc finger domain-containing protein [Nocardioidaceae bacterium]